MFGGLCRIDRSSGLRTKPCVKRKESLDIPFIYLSACATVATVLSLLPITVAGVGTRDAVFILLLGQIGIARQESLALSTLALAVFLINCVIFYIISAVFGGGREVAKPKTAHIKT